MPISLEKLAAEVRIRTNLGNAKIFGLSEDLNLTGTEFNTSLVIYFVAYCFFDVPATLVIRKVKPHIYRA